MISFIIPVFKSTESLIELCDRISIVFSNKEDDFEIIFIDDCGGYDSWKIINELALNNSRVHGYRLSRNYGQHNALLCGIREAKGDIIVTLDDDLQHLPEEIPKILDKLNEGYDVVYGSPEKEQHGLLRDLASKITKSVLKKTIGAENAKNVSALRAFRSELRDAFVLYKSPNVNIDVLLTWSTKSFSAIKVKHDSRKYGKSGYSLNNLINHALNMFTGFSIRPLQISSFIGFLFATIGLLMLFYILIKWIINGSSVPGFSFIASAIALFSGVQLIALGMIGEYLARMYLRIMEQPPYVIRNKTP
jgi:glycosyltransferase involved in cell wall biosynthesis